MATTQPHPVDRVPPFGQLAALGLRHVLAMYAGAVAVPLIVGSAMRMSPADIGHLVSADLLVSGVLMIALAPVWGRLLRSFPPLVTGTVILVIGLSLLPVAVNWAAGGVGADDFGAPRNLGLAAGVLLIILLVHRFAPPSLTRIAVLLRVVLGTLLAIPFGFTDFSGLDDAAWFGVSTPFHFGPPTFEVAAIVSMAVVMVVTMTETTART